MKNTIYAVIGLILGLILGIGAYHIIKPRTVPAPDPIEIIKYEYVDTCTVVIDSSEIYRIVREGILKKYRSKPTNVIAQSDTEAFQDSLKKYLGESSPTKEVEEARMYTYDVPDELKPMLEGSTGVVVEGSEIKDFVQDLKLNQAVLEKRYEKVIKIPSPPKIIEKEVPVEMPKLRHAILVGVGGQYFHDGVNTTIRTGLDQFQYNVGIGWKDKKDRVYLGTYSPNLKEVSIQAYVPLFKIK